MARRQHQFCTSTVPLLCCSTSTSSQASTSGREASDFSFNLVGHQVAERQRRPLPFASTVIKAQVTPEKAATKPSSSGDKPIHDVLAGAVARAISQGTIHPIDTLKVRMQAATRTAAAGNAAGAVTAPPSHHLPPSQPQQPPLTRVASALKSALGDAKSLYRGVLGAASGAGIIIGAFFAFYSTSKRLLRERTDLSEGTVAFIAGAVAAVGSSVVKVPIAVCIRSVQAGVYPNVFTAATEVVRKAGPRGLFTGFLPTLLEDVPDMAVKFAVYETLRAVHMQLHHQERPSTLEDLVMGGFAGSAAAAATTPLDVVKTRMMCNASERPTVMQAARGVLAERPGGLGSFFRGVGPRALSNGLNSAIFYMWFELLRARLRDLLAERQRQMAAGQAIPALLVGQEAEYGSLPQPGSSSRGSGHQAVASCSQRWLAMGDMARAADSTTPSCTAGSRSELLADTGSASPRSIGYETGGAGSDVATGSASPLVAVSRRASSEPVSNGSSGRIACLSLALPLVNVAARQHCR